MNPIEGEFFCRKCQNPLSILKIIVSKKGFAIFEVQCPKKHSGKRRFNMAQQTEWMPAVIKHLYLCPKCGSTLSDVRQKTAGDKTGLILNCPTHGKIKKAISTSFWYAMDALRKQLSARPAYPSSYPQQYPASNIPPSYQQTGYQQLTPNNPYGAHSASTKHPLPAGQYPPPPIAPPETVSPPNLEVVPPTRPSAPSNTSNTIEIPHYGDNINAGDICPACGEPISQGAKFCTNCGTELE
ncbi:MAG: zinc ribbon domain-containing protein [Promethearchaeota archaeon]